MIDDDDDDDDADLKEEFRFYKFYIEGWKDRIVTCRARHKSFGG